MFPNSISGVLDAWTFFYAADWTALAAGTSKTEPVRIDAGVDFVCQGLLFSASFNASTTPTSATANAKFYREAAADSTLLTSAHLGMLTLEIMTGERPWVSRPLRCDLVTGEPGKLFLFPNPVLVKGNDTILATLKSNLPSTVGGASNPLVDAQLIFAGYKILRNGNGGAR